MGCRALCGVKHLWESSLRLGCCGASLCQSAQRISLFLSERRLLNLQEKE